MKNHAKPHKNAQKHTKHKQMHMRTHNDDMSRVFGFGCDVGFDCGFCFGWTKHAGHVIPFAVQPMQEPRSKAISQPKPKNRDMSSCWCGRHTSLLKPLKGGDIQGSAQEAPKRHSRSAQEGSRVAQKRPKAGQVTPKERPRVSQTPPK